MPSGREETATVAAALDAMIATAKDNGIPVFTNMPGDVKQGVMFSLGADYFEVGRNSGLLAARILDGENPADIPVENVVPKQLALNLVTPKTVPGQVDVQCRVEKERQTDRR